MAVETRFCSNSARHPVAVYRRPAGPLLHEAGRRSGDALRSPPADSGFALRQSVIHRAARAHATATRGQSGSPGSRPQGSRAGLVRRVALTRGAAVSNGTRHRHPHAKVEVSMSLVAVARADRRPLHHIQSAGSRRAIEPAGSFGRRSAPTSPSRRRHARRRCAVDGPSLESNGAVDGYPRRRAEVVGERQRDVDGEAESDTPRPDRRRQQRTCISNPQADGVAMRTPSAMSNRLGHPAVRASGRGEARGEGPACAGPGTGGADAGGAGAETSPGHLGYGQRRHGRLRCCGRWRGRSPVAPPLIGWQPSVP